MNRLFTIGIIAIMHSALCWLVSQWALRAIPHVSALDRSGFDVSRWLVYLSKLLYAPLITFGLYPRFAFPGHWIWVPIFANSIIWAGVIYSAYHIINKGGFFKRSKRL